MAISFARECQFPQDLENASKNLDEEIGNRLIANQALAQAVVDSIGNLPDLVDQATAELEDILKQGQGQSNLRTTDDVVDTFGLQKDPSTQLDDERFVFFAGMVLTDKVGYLPGSLSTNAADSDNIDILRRLYYAVGRDLSKTTELLNTKTKTFFVYNKIELRLIPAKVPNEKAFSLEEIIALTNRTELTQDDITVNADFSTYILLKTFLGVDQSFAEIKKRFGLNDNQVIVDVFHLDSVDNSTSSIARYEGLGFTGTKLFAILNGQDLQANSNTNIIPTSIDNAQNKASVLVQNIQFVQNRLGIRFSESAQQTFQTETIESISSLQEEHQQILADSLYQVAVIRRRDVIEKLREKHTDQKIKDFLEQRREVKGIYFDPPDDIFFKNLRITLDSAPPGSTLISNRFLNQPNEIIISQRILLSMYSDLSNALSSIEVTPIRFSSVGEAKDALINYGAKDPDITRIETVILAAEEIETQIRGTTSSTQTAAEIESVANTAATSTADTQTTTQTVGPNGLVIETTTEAGASGLALTGIDQDPTNGLGVFQGQGAGGSPSTILTEQLDTGKTLDIGARLAALDGSYQSVFDIYPPDVAQPLAKVINIVAQKMSQVLKGCQNILNALGTPIFEAKKKIEAFMGKFNAMFGQGSFETSVLKCAVNLNLSTDVFGPLLGLLRQIAQFIQGFTAALGAWISDTINKILCLPVNLINNFLGSVEAALPTACQISRFDLGSTLAQALDGLKNVATAKQLTFAGSGRDLIKFGLQVSVASEKLGQFGAGACDSPASSAFANTSLLNISGGVSTTPISPSGGGFF